MSETVPKARTSAKFVPSSVRNESAAEASSGLISWSWLKAHSICWRKSPWMNGSGAISSACGPSSTGL